MGDIPEWQPGRITTPAEMELSPPPPDNNPLTLVRTSHPPEGSQQRRTFYRNIVPWCQPLTIGTWTCVKAGIPETPSVSTAGEIPVNVISKLSKEPDTEAAIVLIGP